MPEYASWPATDEMLTMWPRLRCTMGGAKARVNSITAATFVCSIVNMSCATSVKSGLLVCVSVRYDFEGSDSPHREHLLMVQV